MHGGPLESARTEVSAPFSWVCAASERPIPKGGIGPPKEQRRAARSWRSVGGVETAEPRGPIMSEEISEMSLETVLETARRLSREARCQDPLPIRDFYDA